MVEPREPKRILVACRGWIARRLLASYRSVGIETVAVFSEPDAEASWLEDADFDAYLNGRTVPETYLSPDRIVGAAMDAGCEAIHPGIGPLSGHLGLYEQATQSNLGIIGAPPDRILGIVDRRILFGQARRLKIPVIPSSGVIAEGADGIGEAAKLSLPLFVKAVCGSSLQRIDAFRELAQALERIRDEAEAHSGERAVFLEGAVRGARRLSVVVVADHHGTCVHLGHLDASPSPPDRGWVQLSGADGADGADGAEALQTELGAMSLALAHAVGWRGVGVVRWLLASGRPWLESFSPCLPAGLELIEAIQGIDLIDAQHRALIGERLAWEQPAPIADRCGVQVQLLAGPGEGTLETLELPPEGSGIQLTPGADPGQRCGAETDPVLAKLTSVGPDRSGALRRMDEALAQVRIEGIQCNLEPLRACISAALQDAGG